MSSFHAMVSLPSRLLSAAYDMGISPGRITTGAIVCPALQASVTMTDLLSMMAGAYSSFSASFWCNNSFLSPRTRTCLSRRKSKVGMRKFRILYCIEPGCVIQWPTCTYTRLVNENCPMQQLATAESAPYGSWQCTVCGKEPKATHS